MKMQVTQYGLSRRVGGWDGVGDSGTDNWLGCANNILNTSSCALSKPAEQGLSAKPGDLLKIVFDAHHVYYRRFDDRTSQDPGVIPNARCDFFFPWTFDKSIPGADAEVTVA